MALALVVTQPFADYALGDRITDAKTVQSILADHSQRVVKISVPDPEPAAPAAKPASNPAPAAGQN